ncbi:MAG: hypothetical protein JSR61_08260 [Proteobacteria bacterium]|nr:hypothetical protein [Pseudomonadota bacterium]
MRISDIGGLTIGAALLITVLSALVFFAPALKPDQHEPTADEIAAKIRQKNLIVRRAYRQGTILFVDPEACTDYSFDNWTGNIRYNSEVDCDERLAKMQKTQVEKSAERMRSVIEGFRR